MSEPSYRLINPQANRSFVFKWEPFDLTTRWHYHPEVELIYFISGRTNGVIGQGFQVFGEGDLVMLGANFPHVLQPNKEFTRDQPHHKPFGLIIQFTECFLGSDFISKPELQGIGSLLQKARQGISFHREATALVAPLLAAMHTMNEPRKLITLLEILVTLSETDAYEYLTSEQHAALSAADEQRMQQINQYVYDHFTEHITLRQIAAVANMSETAFCRYFKSRTLKHFSLFLNEIRISYACKLLNTTNASIAHVCYESGFNDVSYFNRTFKRIMKMSPRQYQSWKEAL